MAELDKVGKHKGQVLLYDGRIVNSSIKVERTTVAWGVTEAQTGVKQWLSGYKALYFDEKTVIIKLHISK